MDNNDDKTPVPGAPAAAKKVYSMQALFLDERESGDFSMALAGALADFTMLRGSCLPVTDKDDLAAAARTTVREAGGEWRPFEVPFTAQYVAPRGLGRAVVAISPAPPKGFNDPWCDGRAFRLSAVVAGEGAGDVFRLVQVFLGARPLFEPVEGGRVLHVGPVPIESPGAEEAIAEPGAAITIYVLNTGKERRSFAGRLVGQQRAT